MLSHERNVMQIMKSEKRCYAAAMMLEPLSLLTRLLMHVHALQKHLPPRVKQRR